MLAAYSKKDGKAVFLEKEKPILQQKGVDGL
jgi:hypothetical protein